MSQPLSGVQPFPRQQGGMMGGPRGRIIPDGSYTVMGVGDPHYGYNGDGAAWTQYPYIISAENGYAAPSTITGVPAYTYPPLDSELKVGGGPTKAEVPDYGGTAAY